MGNPNIIFIDMYSPFNTFMIDNNKMDFTIFSNLFELYPDFTIKKNGDDYAISYFGNTVINRNI